MKVAIIGTGYVGLTTGACLASLGHDVICADVDAAKIATLEQGRIPIVEDGLEEVVAGGVAAGLLRFTADPQAAVADRDFVFLCVPTPQDEDGRADLNYVETAARNIGPHVPPGAVVINKSTVPVGSTGVVEAAMQRSDVAVVSNPEFLREGTAVSDFLHPDRVVIGAVDTETAQRVADLYAGLDTTVLLTDPPSAETIKYAANAFLATKLSFVNAVAALCEAVGADIGDVTRGMGLDPRIGSSFMSPGPGWGGSCFPKDTKALMRIASDRDYDFALLQGVIDVNDEQHQRVVHKVADAAGRGPDGDLAGVAVAAWGLSFKAGTDDVRESPAVAVLSELVRLGATVAAYDPSALPVNDVTRVESAMEACRGADVLVVLTEWPEFADVDLTKVAEVMRGAAVVDARNLLDPVAVGAANLSYRGIGRR